MAKAERVASPLPTLNPVFRPSLLASRTSERFFSGILSYSDEKESGQYP